MISIKESMMNTQIETDVIWDSLYGTLIKAFDEELKSDQCLALKVGRNEIASKTFTYDTEDEIAVTNVDLKVAEGSKYPIKVPALSQATIDLYKYGRRIPITKEMVMFNQFSMMDFSMRAAGKTMALTKDALVWAAASSGTGQSETYASPLGMDIIVNMIEDLEGNGYDGKKFVFHPSLVADTRRLEELYNPNSGFTDGVRTKNIGSIYGIDLISTRMVGSDTGYLLDTDNALIFAEAMPLNIETYEEKSMDLTNIKSSFMGGAGVLRANAICKLS